MGSSGAGGASALLRGLLWSFAVCALLADGGAAAAQTEAPSTTQQATVNRGAARQIYGSGSLRQAAVVPTATAAAASGTPAPSVGPSKVKEEPRNALDRGGHAGDDGRHGSERPAERANKGYGRERYWTPGRHKIDSLPPDFYGVARPAAPADEEEDEAADGEGQRQQPPGQAVVRHRGEGRGRGIGRYGEPDAGRGGAGDGTRLRAGPERGHGVGRHDELGADDGPKGPKHQDEDEAVDGLEEEPLPCDSICMKGELLCESTCSCIPSESAPQECDDGTSLIDYQYNETCSGNKSVSCPTTGKCIAKELICDGENDCGDFSDESHCGSQKNCTADEFECRNGLCIRQSWACDGDNDCKDFSDEESCEYKKLCFDPDFECQDGTCIMDFMRCNGFKDCADGSDELKCDVAYTQCNENQFQCANPRCILMIFRCDGDDDCGDRSDEENCPTSSTTSCNTNEFRCGNGKCISKKFVCDREVECKDGEDEHGCQYPVQQNCSLKYEFACTSGHCIPHSHVCDGVPDCSNGEDEESCPISCELTQYMCKPSPKLVNNITKTSAYAPHWLSFKRHHLNGCINAKHVCDGTPDCPEKDDEENCPKKINCTAKDKCSQQCVLTIDNKKGCACNPGYVLDKDNTTCVDINECKFEQEPVCSQLCKNLNGSFACECTAGYVLRPDLRTCKALGANPTLLLANRVDIRQVSINGPKTVSVFKGLQNAIALDYHYKKEVIYWSDVSMDVIRKVYINGSGSEDVIRWGLQSPGGIAIDWIHDLLFWTDSGTRRVEVMTLDKRVRHVLVSSDLDKPRAIAVHPHYGFVYWTDWGPKPKIERADMDGSHRTALITENIHWPNGLCIDYTTDRLYWIDAKHRVIESAHIYGIDRKKVLSRGLHHPFAITVFEDSVYWTDWHFKSISLANKNNGQGYKTIHWSLHFPMDIHSFHPQRQPYYINHCGYNNGGCSHMCLPNSMGYSCVCPVGLKIKNDGKTCTASADDLLIFARRKDLRIISLDQSAKAFDVVIPVDNVIRAIALTWNSDDDTIYWTDLEAETISRANLDGTNQQVIVHHNLESPAGIALDWVTKKLYWTDAGTNRIECSNLDGTMRTLLIYEGLDKPRDIVLDPSTSYMYWSDWGNQPMIEVAEMNGLNRRKLISTNLKWPNGLAIDFEKKYLYWTDGGTGKIEYSDLQGQHRTTLIESQDTRHPFGLAIHKNKIYWTDWNTMSIYSASKDPRKALSTSTVIRSEISDAMDVAVFHRNRSKIDNPCQHNNGNCSHLCLLAHTPTRYSCACPTGLILASDGKSCPIMPMKFLLMSHRIDIRILSLDTNYTAGTVMSSGYMKNVSGADVDLETGNIYWTDPGQIVNKAIMKSSFKSLFQYEDTIIDGYIDTVDSLVIDSVGRKLYWTDVGLNSVEVSELDGKNRKVLVWSGLDNPRAIALHYPAGLLFWTDWGHNARIERADMDGEHRAAVITEGLTWPNGLSIDMFADRIYWNDAKHMVIESSDLQGQNRQVIVEKVQHPYGLAIVGDFIYWSDWQEKALLRAKKEGGKSRKIVLRNLEGLMDIRLIDKQQVRPENICDKNNGGCSHLCLRNPNGYSCACPTGIIINKDNKTCNSTPTNFLLLATLKRPVLMSLDTPEMWEVPIKQIRNAGSVDFHWGKQLIFYTDLEEKSIRSINMRDFGNIKTVVSDTNFQSSHRIAVDWLADNIYWTDVRQESIEVARLDGSCRKKLIENLKTPKYLVIFPKEGYLYWVQWGVHPGIERANLDGTNRKTIVATDSMPGGLTIDYAARKLYWADTLKDRIEVSDLHGRYRIALVPDATNAFGLSQYGNNIYWFDWNEGMIEKVDKRTGQNRIKVQNTMVKATEVRAVSAERQPGWTPCAMENGGCSHLCFFVKKTYVCACPDQPDFIPCSTEPKKRMPLRKPGTENDPSYDDVNDEELPPAPKTSSGATTRDRPPDDGAGGGDDDDSKLNEYNRASADAISLRTIITTTVILLVITVGIIVVIIYLQCPRKNKREEYLYGSRRNVLTFSNPNYNASGAAAATGSEAPTPTCAQQQDNKKGFIWKRLKYDKSQERVYEDNGQATSPEFVSLIPPASAAAAAAPTASSSAGALAPAVCGDPESSPPVVACAVQRLEPPSIVACPRPRPAA